MATPQKLKIMLANLIPCIEGDWFLIGGGMLGLTRSNDLIPYDNDLDILLMPNASINVPEHSKYKIQNYYMDSKFYDSTLPAYKPKNLWTEFLNYYRKVMPNVNRAVLFREASKHYKEQCIVPEFSLPFIDIYRASKTTDGWIAPYWDDYLFKEDELMYPVISNDLGFPVRLPSDTEEVCRRQYGDDWRTPIQGDWKKNIDWS